MNALEIGNIKSIWYKYPQLEFQEYFIGGTDYLDGVRLSDMTSSIMVGIDRYKRYYMVIRYQCLDEEWAFDGNIYPVEKGGVYLLTLFQRYSDRGDIWCRSGTNGPWLYGSPVSLGNEGMKEVMRGIERLERGESVVYLDYENKKASKPTIEKELRVQLV